MNVLEEFLHHENIHLDTKTKSVSRLQVLSILIFGSGLFENVLCRSPEGAAQLALYLKLVRYLITINVQSSTLLSGNERFMCLSAGLYVIVCIYSPRLVYQREYGY